MWHAFPLVHNDFSIKHLFLTSSGAKENMICRRKTKEVKNEKKKTLIEKLSKTLWKVETFSVLQKQPVRNASRHFSVYPKLNGGKPLYVQKSVTSTMWLVAKQDKGRGGTELLFSRALINFCMKPSTQFAVICRYFY